MTKDTYAPKIHIVLLCKGVDIFVHYYVTFNACQVIQRFLKTTIYPWGGHYGIHTQLGYQKRMIFFKRL